MNEALEKAREAAKLKREQGIPVVRLNPMEAAKADKTSRSKAIKAKCYDCVGQDSDPDWRGQIKHCPCTDCPLYPVRPYKA